MISSLSFVFCFFVKDYHFLCSVCTTVIAFRFHFLFFFENRWWKSFTSLLSDESFSQIDTLMFFFIAINFLDLLNKEIIIIVFRIYDFQLVDHLFSRNLLSENIRIVQIIIATQFRSFRSYVSIQNRKIRKSNSISYSIHWITQAEIFSAVVIQFHFEIEIFRQTKTYRNFRFKRNSSFESLFIDIRSSEKSKHRFADLIIFSRKHFVVSNVFRDLRFRSISNSKNSVRSFIRSFRISFTCSSQTFFFSFLISLEADIDLNSKKRNFSTDIDSHFIDSNFIHRTSIIEEISRRNIIDFINEKRREIVNIVIVVMIAFRAKKNDEDNDEENNEKNENDFSSNEYKQFNVSKWTFEIIEYYDSEYEKSTHIDSSIIFAEKFIWYRDVYVFIDRLKKMTFLRDDAKLLIVVFHCIKNIAFYWHTYEFSKEKKKFFRNRVTLDDWYRYFIRRFKKRIFTALIKFQSQRYTMTNARDQKNSRVFVQNIYRHFKIVEFDFVFNQNMMTWNNMNWKFRRDISESIATTSKQIFFDQLNNKAEIWYDMTKHFDRDQQISFFSNVDNRKIQNNKQNFDKQKNRTKKRFDYNQSDYYSQYRFDYYYFFKSFNSIYQYQNKSSNDDRQQSQFRLSFAKLFLQIIDENASDSRTNQRNSRFIDRFFENIFRNNVNSRENDYNRSRRAYVIDEQNEEFIEKKIEKDFFNDDQNSSKNETFYFEKLNYYNSNYSKQKKIKIVYCEFRNCYVYHLSTLRIFFFQIIVYIIICVSIVVNQILYEKLSQIRRLSFIQSKLHFSSKLSKSISHHSTKYSSLTST